MSASDEPTKLRSILVPLFADEQYTHHQLDNGSTSDLVLGVAAQDDCAAYRLVGEQTLVFGSDYVRGPKFFLYEAGLLSDYDIGWYLAGANLSDVAAMGALPVGLLSVIRYPKDLSDDSFAEVARGIRDCCASVRAANVGGDIGTAERIILSASAFGVVEPDGLLTRAGARPGQLVVLTGPTGLAGSAMKYAQSEIRRHELPDAVLAGALHKWRRVAPRVDHGRRFATEPGATACVDTSDGLAGAFEALCSASGVGMTINEDRVPLHPTVQAVGQSLGLDPWELVFGDSVDFELVATVDADRVAGLIAATEAAGLELYVIGEVTPERGTVLRSQGVDRPIPGVAWTHTS